LKRASEAIRAALRAFDAKLEYLADRVKKLEGGKQ